MRGERRNVLVGMKEAVGDLCIFVHINDVQDEHTSDLSSNHVALRDGSFRFELIEEFFPMVRAMAFKLDSHDGCQMSLDAIRVNDCNDPLNRAHAL